MHAVKTQLLYALVLKSLSFFEANEHCNILVDTYVSLLLLYGHANVFSQYTHNVLSMYSVLKGFFCPCHCAILCQCQSNAYPIHLIGVKCGSARSIMHFVQLCNAPSAAHICTICTSSHCTVDSSWDLL